MLPVGLESRWTPNSNSFPVIVKPVKTPARGQKGNNAKADWECCLLYSWFASVSFSVDIEMITQSAQYVLQSRWDRRLEKCYISTMCEETHAGTKFNRQNSHVYLFVLGLADTLSSDSHMDIGGVGCTLHGHHMLNFMSQISKKVLQNKVKYIMTRLLNF